MKQSITYILVLLCLFDSLHCQNKILISEDFEVSNKQELLKRWQEISNLSAMSLSNDKAPVSTGEKSLMMVYNPDRNNGGHLFKTIDQAFNQVFVRFYCKFSKNHSPINQFVKLGGYNPLTEYSQKDFNILPIGDDRFSAGPIIRSDFGFWDLSANWMGMKIKPDTILLSNHFNPNPSATANTNKWYCVEYMIKLNDPLLTPGGELALWIDGKKVIHLGQGFPTGFWDGENFHPASDNLPFEGFQWRKDNNLTINYFWLLYYMTDGITGLKDTLWVDDLIVSTAYNGPIGGSNIFSDEIQNEKFINFNQRTNSVSLQGLSNDEIISQIRVYNLLGKKIIDLQPNFIPTTSSNEISLGNISLEKGFYFVSVKTDKSDFYSKFLIASD